MLNRFKPSATQLRVLFCLLFLGVLITINVLFSSHIYRFDLTSDKLYSLSPSSKEILNNLDDFVTIRVYFSSNLPPHIAPIRQQVVDLLSEYDIYGKGSVQIEFHDPLKNQLSIERMRELGVLPLQLSVIEKDKRSVIDAFLGMSIHYEDRHEVIPIVRSSVSLEYTLTTLIEKLVNTHKKKVGFLFRPGRSFSMGLKTIYGQLSPHYELVTLYPGNSIPNELDTLVVISPKEVPEFSVVQVERYILQGGNILFLMDTMAITANMKIEEVTTGFEALFHHYGVEVSRNMVVDAQHATAPFSSGYMTYSLPYPLWPKLTRKQFKQNHPALGRLHSLVLPWSSSLHFRDAHSSGLTKENLVFTSDKNGSLTGNINLSPRRRFPMRDQDPQLMVGLLKGVVSSFYDHADITSQAESKIVIVGDSDFVLDGLVRKYPDNTRFLTHMVDWLSLNDALIDIRVRVRGEYPLVSLGSSRLFLLRLGGIFGVSLCLLVILWVRYIRRQKQRKNWKGSK
ncbi:MAG: GldG family protein [Candidatus Margulisbacteria bacterium]|nr:GldG family protein [Candidatus Margulisiibacteriota bacterium]